MRRNSYSFFKTCAAFVVSMAFVMCFISFAESAQPIKVGVNMPLSGAFVRLGRTATIAAEMAVEEINAKGGILGRPIELIVRDNATNPEISLRNAKDLVYKEKVDWLAGPISTASVLGVSKFAKESKTLSIAYNSGVHTVGKFGHRYHFKFQINSRYIGKSSAPALKHFFPQVKKWFILMPDYEYGHAIAKSLWKELKRIDPGAQLVGEAFFPYPQIQDFSPFITKILGSGCEGLISSMPGAALQTWVMQTAGFGLHKKIRVYCAEYGSTEVISPLKGSAAELNGALAGIFYPFYMLDNPMNNHFYKAYFQREKEYPGSISAVAYSSYHVMKDVIEAVGEFDKERIIDALEDRTVDTTFGPTLIRGCDHAMMIPYYFGIMNYDKSKWLFSYARPETKWYLDPSKGSYTCEQIRELRKQEAGK